MISKGLLVFNTIRFLKYSQILWQMAYRLMPQKYINPISNDMLIEQSIFFTESQSINSKFQKEKSFVFLNIKKHFKDKIDWNFLDHGKLWNYNLEYFDYLFQQDISVEEKNRLIYDFYNFSIEHNRVLEPYPVSLRCVNIIKYALIENQCHEGFLSRVYKELVYLHKHYEFHILGNHLLENAFALCLGGAFFNEEKWHKKAIKILQKELNNQILEDGAHFELSPMYHKIIFFRLLELIDWYGDYKYKKEPFVAFCKEKASLMLSWLEAIQFENGDIPLFNDAANGIAVDTDFLKNYATKLGIQSSQIPLKNSGYRTFKTNRYEIKMDLAQIGASYQPGHGHADALSFILYYEGEPLFVEQGTSTYQIGERRNLERSTQAHNTVEVNGVNQSEVWGGFRVGRRARTTIVKETGNYLEAIHDGYKRFGVVHRRSFSLEKDEIVVLDTLSKETNAIFYIHIHPSCTISDLGNGLFLVKNKVKLSFDGFRGIEIQEYEYADTYNQYQRAKRLVISFKKRLKSTLVFGEAEL